MERRGIGRTHSSRFRGTKRSSSVSGGDRTGAGRVSLGLAPVSLVKLESVFEREKRAAMGESAGRGLRRTGDCVLMARGTGWDDCERNAANDTIEAKVEGF